MADDPRPWPFPWIQPKGVADDDGPREPAVFEIDGCKFHVSPTGDSGINSGRGRFRVECLTHAVVMHENTTGGSVRCRDHLDEIRREREKAEADAGAAMVRDWRDSMPAPGPPAPSAPAGEPALRLIAEIARLRAASASAPLTRHEEALLCREFIGLSRHYQEGSFTADWINRAAEDLWRIVFEIK